MSDEHDPERERGDGREREDGHDRVDTSHLDGVEDGCGCAEVWEHLSEGRGDDSEGEGDPDDGSADDLTATVTGASES